ncbi:hypothetical protein BGZ81_005815 [Podila clonocystis]|nr:hypothetical protein BGZ81_005815 [Podila clonocystis]
MAPSVAEISATSPAKEATPNQKKNVVVIGGSCVAVSTILTGKKILPSTHRLIIIEKHSHFHYMFAFPRACVIQDWENELFVPYTKVFEDAPDKGQVIHALATNITKTHVELDREIEGFGNKVEYEYLIYGTGARHPEPGNLNDHDTKAAAINRLKETQEKIKKSTKVLIIGGGAVGLELATEIREHFPEKEVTLVHSREQYMMSYKLGMHKEIVKILKKFGVRQIMGDRAIVPEGGFVDDFKMIKVVTKKGQEIECDLQTGGAAWGQADLCIRNICKMIANPKIQAKDLGTHTPMAPQIMLYFGLAKGISQLKIFRLFVITADFILKRFFSYNIMASRAWTWLGTPLSKETADL